MRGVLLLVTVLTLLPVARTAAEPFYANDFEETCDVRLWVSRGETEIHTLDLVEEAPWSGQRCAKIDFTCTERSHIHYFKVPIGLPWEMDRATVIDGMVKVHAPDHVTVALGYNRRLLYQGQDLQGNRAVTPVCEQRDEWVRLLSRDISELLKDDVGMRGLSPKVELEFESIYVHIQGAQQGDRVTVWLDDLALRPPTDEDRAQWAAQAADLQFDDRMPDYPRLDETFVWGVTGSLEGMNRYMDLPIEVFAALTARDWKENFFDHFARLGGMVMMQRPDGEEKVAELLDLAAEHDFSAQISFYITGYYEPEVPREDLADLGRRMVARFKNHQALAAWYVVDEPRPQLPVLRDHWMWARRLIEPLDPSRPLTCALNNPTSVRMYSKYCAVSMIDWYPLGRADLPGMYPVLSPAAMCEAAWESGARHIWFIPQAYADPRKRRLPTAPEVRLMTYLPLACGATGVIYYAFQSRPTWHPWGGAWTITDMAFNRPSEMGQEVRRLGRVIPIIGPVLLGTTWTANSDIKVRCDPIPEYGFPSLRADLNRGDDYDVIVVCNQDVNQASAGAVQLPTELLEDRKLYDLNARSRIAPEGEAFEVTLEPGDGRFYLLAPEGVARRIFDEIDGRMCGKLQRIYDVELAEAQAVGVDTNAATEAAARSDNLAGAGRLPQAVEAIEQARTALANALADHEAYSGYLGRITTIQASYGNASARFSDFAAAIPSDQRRGRLEGDLSAHVEGMLAICADWHMLRYALMTGDIDYCERELPGAEQRAATTIAGLEVILAGQ